MAFTNFSSKEIHGKVLVVGAHGAGKTAFLQSLVRGTSGEVASGLFEFEAGGGRQEWFDFLPVSVGQYDDFHVKLHFLTLPKLAALETTQQIAVRGVDACLMVIDSRLSQLPQNFSMYEQTQQILASEGCNLATLPRVLVYNRRDGAELVDVDVLRHEFNSAGSPDFETVATKDVGTLSALGAMAELIVGVLAKR